MIFMFQPHIRVHNPNTITASILGRLQVSGRIKSQGDKTTPAGQTLVSREETDTWKCPSRRNSTFLRRFWTSYLYITYPLTRRRFHNTTMLLLLSPLANCHRWKPVASLLMPEGRWTCLQYGHTIPNCSRPSPLNSPESRYLEEFCSERLHNLEKAFMARFRSTITAEVFVRVARVG